MGHTTAPARRITPWLAALLGVLMTAAMVFMGAAGAHAAPGDDQEKTDFYFAGVIQYEGQPVPDVTMSIKGNGFEGDTKTDADGKWRLYVPEKGDYVLTVDEETLPDGVIVDAEQLPEGIQPMSGTTASFEVTFGLTNTKIVNLFLGEGERVTTSWIDQFVERLMNGLNFGLLLALAAVGISLIFGTTGLSNFAQGEMLTFGAVVALVFGVWLDIPMWLTLIIVVLLGAAFGWAMDAGLWRPLRRKGLGLVQLMIVSIGLSLAIRYTYQFFIGGGTYQLPGAGVSRDIKFGPIALSWIDVVSMATSIVLLGGVAYWLLRTRIGKATRAISDNPSLAAATGINVDRVIRIVWILAAMLAAVAGVLWAYFRPGVKWDMGGQVLLLIFAAVTLGGLGTAFGALIGSLIVGILVEISTLWIPPDMKYVGALAVLIIILLVRPQGILGRKERLG